MSAPAVAEFVAEACAGDQYDVVIVNFANGDMVGHTGVFDAAVNAFQTLDKLLSEIMPPSLEQGTVWLITADHGNCDEMVDPVTGEPHTQHSVYPVPCMVIDEVPWKLATGENLSAIAPTLLQMMGISQPKKMKGKSLLLEEYTN